MLRGVGEFCDVPPAFARDASPVLLEDAERALAAGRYERCLDLSEPLRTPDDEERLRRSLLRARALDGLHREAEALEVLDRIAAPADREMVLVVEALRARVLLHRGDLGAARAILEPARCAAAFASPEVRAEVAYERARAAYAGGELECADAALREIEPSVEAFGPRAESLRALIAYQRNDHLRAVELGHAAFARASTAAETDAPVAAEMMHMLATLAVERLDFALWSYVGAHAGDFDLTLGAFSELGHRLHWGRSALYEANGEPEDALDAARDLSRAAATQASALLGRCRRAAVLLHYGERLAYQNLASSIRRQFESLDLGCIRDWTTAALPLEVAETLALMGDVEGATRALTAHGALISLPPSPYSANTAWLAMRTFAEGVVADASGSSLLARRRYRQAFEAYRAIGFTRRAMNAALRLADMTGDEAFPAYVDDHSRALSSRSWIRVKLASSGVRHTDPVLHRLTRAEREVLAYLVEGRSTADIAAARSRSPQTTRNTVSKLFAAFGVGSRPALVREVRRRGLVDADGVPTWRPRDASTSAAF